MVVPPPPAPLWATYWAAAFSKSATLTFFLVPVLKLESTRL
jgi:hypothetical protein